MLACKEVTRIVAAEELDEAGWKRRLAIRLHLLMCRHCRRYAAQLRAIGKAAHSILGTGPEDQDSDAIERLERAILEPAPSEGIPSNDSRRKNMDTPSDNGGNQSG